MHKRLVGMLACPRCGGALAASSGDEEIVEGELACGPCQARWPIVRGIPRFVPPDNYTASFGMQWNEFRTEQLDSFNGTDLSRRRFFSETGWTPDWLAGRWVLDVGCGAGRFLDVASSTKCEVIGVDMSNAVDAAARNLAGRPNVHLIQASAFELPLAPRLDACYCIGVLQHTPDPPRALAALARVLKPGGRLAVTIYERRRFSKLYSKYLLRPITTRVDQQHLLRAIRWTMPLLFPLTDVLFRVPLVGRAFRFAIPVANYVDEKQLSRAQRYNWAVLDTFDMLAPAFDQPQTLDEARDALAGAGMIGIERLPNGGLNLVAEKP